MSSEQKIKILEKTIQKLETEINRLTYENREINDHIFNQKIINAITNIAIIGTAASFAIIFKKIGL